MPYNVTDSADIGSKGIARISNNNVSGLGTSGRTLPSSDIPKQGKQAPVLHGNLLDSYMFSIHPMRTNRVPFHFPLMICRFTRFC